MPLLATGWIAWPLTIFAAILFVIAVYQLIDTKFGAAATCGVFVVLLGFGAYYGHTHRVVAVNTTAIVLNNTTGRIEGETRTAGVTNIPLIGGEIVEFPAQSNAQHCDIFTPSVKGGYEVSTVWCFYFDASRVDWTAQFRRYGSRSFADLTSIWKNQLAQKVAAGVRQYQPRQLTDERDAVASEVLGLSREFFASEGIALNSVVLANWDFTSDEVRNQYNATLNSQNQVLVEEGKLEAAKARRNVEVYEAQTLNIVLQERAKAQFAYLQGLGITDPDAIARILTIQYLQGLPTPPDTVILSTGASSVQPTVPATPR